MIEILVLSTCLSVARGEGCNPALKAYYYEKPTLRRKIKKVQDELLFYTGDWIAYAVPAAAIATKIGSAQIKFSRSWSIQSSNNETLLLFRKDF